MTQVVILKTTLDKSHVIVVMNHLTNFIVTLDAGAYEDQGEENFDHDGSRRTSMKGWVDGVLLKVETEMMDSEDVKNEKRAKQ